jgi:hypothetical protein
MWRLTGERAFDTYGDVLNYIGRSRQSPDFRTMARMIMRDSFEITNTRIFSRFAREKSSTKRLVHIGGINRELMCDMRYVDSKVAWLVAQLNHERLLLRFHYAQGAEIAVFERSNNPAVEHRIATPYGNMLQIRKEHQHCDHIYYYNQKRSEHMFGGILTECLYVEIYAAAEITPAELDG